MGYVELTMVQLQRKNRIYRVMGKNRLIDNKRNNPMLKNCELSFGKKHTKLVITAETEILINKLAATDFMVYLSINDRLSLYSFVGFQ